MTANLTREEAPAEGAGEWFTADVVEVEYRDGNGETHMFPSEVEWAEVVRWRPQPSSALRNRTTADGAGPFDRERLAREVRVAWVRWAETQADPKPSWLVPYDELSEPDKEADRQIGEHIQAIVRQRIEELAALKALSVPLALRNRTSEPEAGAVAWRWRVQTGLMDSGWRLSHSPKPDVNAVGLVVEALGVIPAPATADKMRVDNLVRRIRLQVECSSGNLITSGADSEMVRICLSHFNDLADEVAALNEQPQ